MVVSNIVYFHLYLGKISNLTNMFQMGWFNHQLVFLVDCEAMRFHPYLLLNPPRGGFDRFDGRKIPGCRIGYIEIPGYQDIQTDP